MSIIDISVPLQTGLPVWPGDRPLEIRRRKTMDRDGYNLTELGMSAHTGTHVDGSLHFIAGGRAVDQLPLDVLVGPADVVDLTQVEELITAAHLEAAHLPADCRRLLLRTRNSRHWVQGDHTFDEDYVALSADAAEWAIRRGMQLLGIDYHSIEPCKSPGHPVHKMLLQAEVIVLETINLSAVAAGRYQLCCLPLRIAGADGAPARAVLATL